MVKTAETPACEGFADCRHCDMRDIALFAELTEPDFDLIHKSIPQYAFPGGATIYPAGEEGDSVYTVRRGVVKLVHFASDGAHRIVRLLRQGSVAGLETLVGKAYAHTAVALEDVSVCRIAVDDVQRLDRETPRLHRQLLERWYASVRDADHWITGMSTGDARARMAHLLLFLTGVEEECRLFSREDVGAVLGLTPETASHTIADFKRSGLIVQKARNHFHCDLSALRGVAGADSA